MLRLTPVHFDVSCSVRRGTTPLATFSVAEATSCSDRLRCEVSGQDLFPRVSQRYRAETVFEVLFRGSPFQDCCTQFFQSLEAGEFPVEFFFCESQLSLSLQDISSGMTDFRLFRTASTITCWTSSPGLTSTRVRIPLSPDEPQYDDDHHTSRGRDCMVRNNTLNSDRRYLDGHRVPFACCQSDG